MASKSEKLNIEQRTRRKKEQGRKYLGIDIPPRPPSEIPIVSPDIRTMPSPDAYPWTGVRTTLDRQAASTGDQRGVTLQVITPPPGVDADFAVATHPLAKVLRQSPVQIAEEMAANFNADTDNKPPMINEAKALKGFVNFDIEPQLFGNQVLSQVEVMGDRYGEVNVGQGATVVLDTSSPNVAKYMSVGHLRSTVIGESLGRIYQKTGHTVIRDNHLGDWGTQFGMLGHAYELWADEIPEIRDGTNPVAGLYQLYTRINSEIEKEKENGGESALAQEGRAWFKRLEEGDPQALTLLDWATTQSLVEFQDVYKLLGSKFEYTLGESKYVQMLPSVVEAFKDRQIAAEDESGALAVTFDADEKGKQMQRLIIKKSDGASLYATRDLATIAARTEWFNPSKILYVVGGDQQDYFKQVFAAFDKLSDGQGPELDHVYFGMISLPEGKMSTRKGRVVFLKDVLQESIDRARAKVEETDRNLTPGEKDTVARQVGVGAIVYMDLSQGRERNIKFDWEQALSLEGNSGPSIQYSHARAKSVLRKAEERGIALDTERPAEFALPVEQELVKHLATFSEAIVKAMQDNQPSTVAVHVQKTAELFNRFYKDAPILKDDVDDATRNARLRLTAASAQVIKNGLELLGIEAPEKM